MIGTPAPPHLGQRFDSSVMGWPSCGARLAELMALSLAYLGNGAEVNLNALGGGGMGARACVNPV